MARNPKHQRNSADDQPESDVRALMPGRFILRPQVAPNRFTCRHPKHVRCSCHGAAAPPPPRDPAPPKHRAASTNAVLSLSADATPASYAEAIQRIKYSYQKTLVQMLFAVRSFPDAAAAVQRILTAAPADHQPVDTVAAATAPTPEPVTEPHA